MAKIKIMILEDELGLAHTLAAVLEKKLGAGSTVKICSTAEVALQMLQIHKFDLIVSDWHLPGISGLDFITSVRQSFPDIPIIFMTAFGTEQIEERVQAMSGHYLKKPFEVGEFTRMISELLNLSELEIQNSSDSGTPGQELIPRRILVLEDDESLLRLYRKVFEKTGHIVQTSQTFADANQLLEHKNFDMFICDVKIGKNIGVDLLLIWREKLIRNHTCVVVISGDPFYRLVSEKIGADFFFRKPVEISALVNLANNLSISSHSRDLFSSVSGDVG